MLDKHLHFPDNLTPWSFASGGYKIFHVKSRKGRAQFSTRTSEIRFLVLKPRCGLSSLEDRVPTGKVQDVLRIPHDGWKAGLVTTCTGCVDVKQVLTFISPAGPAEL